MARLAGILAVMMAGLGGCVQSTEFSADSAAQVAPAVSCPSASEALRRAISARTPAIRCAYSSGVKGRAY